MEYKNWTIKFVEEGGDYHYSKIIAKTFGDALKYAEKNGYGTLDQVDFVSNEAVDFAE